MPRTCLRGGLQIEGFGGGGGGGVSTDPVLLSDANKLHLCIEVSGQNPQVRLHIELLIAFFSVGDFYRGL